MQRMVSIFLWLSLSLSLTGFADPAADLKHMFQVIDRRSHACHSVTEKKCWPKPGAEGCDCTGVCKKICTRTPLFKPVDWFVHDRSWRAHTIRSLLDLAPKHPWPVFSLVEQADFCGNPKLGCWVARDCFYDLLSTIQDITKKLALVPSEPIDDSKLKELLEKKRQQRTIMQQFSHAVGDPSHGLDCGDHIGEEISSTCNPDGFVTSISLYTEPRVLTKTNLQILEHLSSLKSLNISACAVQNIPDHLGPLDSLEIQPCSEANTLQIAEQIRKLTHLKKLILKLDKDLSVEVLANLGSLTTLEELYFHCGEGIYCSSGEGLNTLPPSIRQMTRLRTLNLYYNNLKELPDWIVELSNLEVLNLGGNVLKEIPPFLSKLTKLRILDLSHNRIEGQIPPELDALENLSTFYIVGNSRQDTRLPPLLCQRQKQGLLHYSYPIQESCLSAPAKAPTP